MGKQQECIRNNKTREAKLNTPNTEQVNVKIKQKYANTQTLTGTHKGRNKETYKGDETHT